MLNKIAQLISHILFRSYDFRKSLAPGRIRSENQQRDIEMTLFLAAIWFCYVAGAAFGAWSFDLWKLRVLFVPITFLMLAVAVDNMRPLSIQEELDQSLRS